LILFLDNRYRVLPNAIHNHLPAHHPGFVATDVNILSCSALNPFAKCAINEEYWHKIDKDLYLGRGFPSKAYLHVRRKREEDLKTTDELVFDVHVGRTPPPNDKPGKNEKWESRPMGLWIKRSSKRHLTDSTKAVTGVDVVFGPDAADPRSNWQMQRQYLNIDARGEHPEPRLTVRKGPSIKVDPPIPRIRKDGKFKILQASDLHLATGFGKCRDPVPDEFEGGPCQADPRTLAFVERILLDEKPDLIILSGDIEFEHSEEMRTWRAERRAVLHTIDIDPLNRAHADRLIRSFRGALYWPHINFYAGDVKEWAAQRLESNNRKPFLDIAVLDMPGVEDYIAHITPALKPGGQLLVFQPQITQIAGCIQEIAGKKLDLKMNTVLELGDGISSGRQWDVRLATLRSVERDKMAEAQKARGKGNSGNAGQATVVEKERLKVEPAIEESGAGPVENRIPPMVCRPLVGELTRGGGFLGLWRKTV